MMRPITELIHLEEPGIDLIQNWLNEAENQYAILPPSQDRENCLYQTQVTTRSPMGAIVYETGGIVIDHGWLRFLGSGHQRLLRTLPTWNDSIQSQSRGYYLVADDALGGFFAINGGGLGPDHGHIYYLPYDDLEWEPLEIGFSQLFEWALSRKLGDFYGEDRWPGWEKETEALDGDKHFFFYPFLWSEEGSVMTSSRKAVAIQEGFHLKMDLIKQL